ncbi:MAG: hypothetical protein Fur0035_23020 [Anaerolineales bacterium]
MFKKLILHPASFLLALALLTYAPFFWQRGFYWDEAPWTWIYFGLGPTALTKTFSTSRPFWGMIYQLTLPLIGPQPWAWQLLMILLRWLSALLVWQILRRLLPQKRLPLWTAALFLVYPALGQNFIALMYSHFYLVLNAFLLSLLLSLLAIEQKKPILHLPALLLAALNLLTMEYFYFLEFLRLVLFFIAHQRNTKRSLLTFSPYLLLFISVTFWRAFFFTNQNASYSYQTLENLKANFLLGAWTLLTVLARSFWESALHAWLFPFEPVNLASLGLLTAIGAFSLALTATLLTGLREMKTQTPQNSSPARPIFLLGLLTWILGGGAFWLIGERTLPQLHFSADRFTLPLMLGASLMLAAALELFARKPRLQIALFALLIGFSVGKQFQTNAAYRRDWETQRNFFWQLSWRVPKLQPGTTLLTNDLPLTAFSDNSLSGPLNWIYNDGAPGMNYILYFASVRTQEGRALGQNFAPGQRFEQNYLATTFHGNTAQMIIVNFAPPGCLRVLDPEIDPFNRLLPPLLRQAAAFSNPALIGAEAATSLPAFYEPESPRGWCFFFAQAELARQRGDWAQVTNLHRQALALNDHANDPLENFVFIEAYAHTGDWDSASALTRDTYKISKEMLRPSLCALWRRIARELPAQAAADAIFASLGCPGG